MSDEAAVITGAVNLENVRRATIRAALRLKIKINMWPNAYWGSNTLKFIRSQYGWTGRTAVQALKFMEELGDAKAKE